MTVLPALLGAAAGVAWLVALISAIAMVRHRAPGVSIFYLMTHGVAFFGGDKFTPEAAPHRRRFFGAFVAFMVCVLGLALVAALRL